MLVDIPRETIQYGRMAKLIETILLESKPVVDREAGVIRNVKFIGFESRNGRRYKPEAIQDALPLYEGCKHYLNHDRTGSERGFQDWAGKLCGVHMGSDGAYGDMHLRKQGPFYEQLMEAAEDFSSDFGLSHVSEGTLHEGEVTKIAEVYSVDIVTDPATTAGLYEDTNPTTEANTVADTSKKLTLRKIVESAPKSTRRHTLLREMVDEGVAAPEMEIEVPAEATPEEMIRDGLMAAVTAALADADDETLKKVLDTLGLSDSVTDSAGTKEPEEGGAAEEGKADEAKKVEESANRKLLGVLAENQLLKAGVDATPERIAAVAAVHEGQRKALVESWSPAPEGYAPASGRPAISPPASYQTASASAENANKRLEESLARGRK